MMFLPAISRFHQSNKFETKIDYGTKSLMQNTEHVDRYNVQREEQETTAFYWEPRNCTLQLQNQPVVAFDSSSTGPPLDPTPLGNYGITVVEEVSLNRFSVPAEEFTDWIDLLRGDGKAEEMDRVPWRPGGVATSSSPNDVNLFGHDESLEDTKPPSKGSIAISSASAVRPELQIKAHQNDQWNERFQELVEYHRTYGHSHVPYHYKKSAPLAWWVKRQRHQYKMKQDGNHHTLTDERKTKLEALGFCWDSHTAVWEERLNELIDHRREHGHITISQADNPKLLIWVKCQRRQFKLYSEGEKSSMTQERIDKLNAVGFCWNPRRASTEPRKDGANK
jgi:hypothetical protein